MASIALPPHQDSFNKTFFKHQFFPSRRPSLDSLSLDNQTAVITGSNTGIGLECGRVLLSLKLSRLILAVRSRERGETAARTLRKLYPEASIEVWSLDMDSYDSIRAFAQRCSTLARFDIAILNAAIMNSEFRTNPSTGHEETFQINYLSTVLLALLLLPTLKARSPGGPPGRLTIVSSVAAVTTAFPEQKAVPLIPAFTRQEGWNTSVAKQRYDTTKLLLLMFILKLSKLVKAEDTVINTVDPGLTDGTSLFRSLPLFLGGNTREKGAWTYVDAAAYRGKESHGSFLSDWNIAPLHPIMHTREGEVIMDRLWDETLQELDFPEVSDILQSRK
ncbi:short-chain dehydrogenase [Thozetella sp. PMI_491]|nr:short-chain dehydrogenase [Thozetella sp. PMI_491]